MVEKNESALAKTGQPKTVKDLVSSDMFRREVGKALPAQVSLQRFARAMLSCINRTPKLLDCSQSSIAQALMCCAELGLEPGNLLGRAYLVPFKNKGRMEVQFIIGYRGIIDLAWRSGKLQDIYSHVVYERDEFDYELGLNRDIKHVPYMGDGNPGKLSFAYAVARLKDGGCLWVVMSRREVDEIRKRSKARDSGPWVTDTAAMWRKTAIRQLAKFLPLTPEVHDALEKEDKLNIEVDAFETQATYGCSVPGCPEVVSTEDAKGTAEPLCEEHRTPVVTPPTDDIVVDGKPLDEDPTADLPGAWDPRELTPIEQSLAAISDYLSTWDKPTVRAFERKVKKVCDCDWATVKEEGSLNLVEASLAIAAEIEGSRK